MHHCQPVVCRSLGNPFPHAAQQPANGTLSPNTTCSQCCLTAASKKDTLSLHMLQALPCSSQQMGHSPSLQPLPLTLHSSQPLGHSLSALSVPSATSQQPANGTLSTQPVPSAASQQPATGTLSLCTIYFPATSKWYTLFLCTSCS